MERLKTYKSIFLVSILVIAGLILPFFYPNAAPHSKLLSSNGNLMWYNSPTTTLLNKYLYIGYTTRKREVVIEKINDNTQQRVSRKVLHQYRYLDDHGAPVIFAIPKGPNKGKLLSIYALHNSNIFSRVTKHPEDINDWEKEQLINDCECTYPNLVELNDSLYLFYRKQTSETPLIRSYFMMQSKDFGSTWSAEKEVIHARNGEWIYAFAQSSPDNSLHLAWGIYTEQFGDIQNIYYAKSNDLGTTWSNSDENIHNSIINSSFPYLINKSETNHATRIWDFTTKNNQPSILSISYNAKQSDIQWMSKNHTQWLNLKLGLNTEAYYPCGASFYANDPYTVYAAKKSGDKNQSGTIFKLEINPNKSSFQIINQIHNTSNQTYCRPQGVENEGNIKMLYTSINEYKSFMDYKTSLYLHTQ